MDYLVDGKKFVLSYNELKQEYLKYIEMSDKEFIENLPGAAHLACIICYLKEIPTYICLSDKGVLHELIHLMHIPNENTTTLNEIRDVFKITLKLD